MSKARSTMQPLKGLIGNYRFSLQAEQGYFDCFSLIHKQISKEHTKVII